MTARANRRQNILAHVELVAETVTDVQIELMQKTCITYTNSNMNGVKIFTGYKRSISVVKIISPIE